MHNVSHLKIAIMASEFNNLMQISQLENHIKKEKERVNTYMDKNFFDMAQASVGLIIEMREKILNLI